MQAASSAWCSWQSSRVPVVTGRLQFPPPFPWLYLVLMAVEVIFGTGSKMNWIVFERNRNFLCSVSGCCEGL